MATKQNKPITEKQVATFTKLIESGMLEHLEDTERWEVVDTVWEFLQKFVEPKSDEIFNTPTSIAEYYWQCDREDELLKALATKCSQDHWGAEDFVDEVLEILDLQGQYLDPDDQDKKFERDLETLLEQSTNYQNRERLMDMLRLSHHSTNEQIINEIKSRI